MSVLARCLVDATFLNDVAVHGWSKLDRIMDDPRTTREFDALDLARVRHFSGFITRVQHNFLWEAFPGTIGLLRRYGIELRVFARYAANHQRLRARDAPQPERVKAFAAFLRSYLEDAGPRPYAGLKDVLEYELAIWVLRRSAVSSVPAGDKTAWMTIPLAAWRNLVPGLRFPVALCAHTTDPIATLEWLERGTRVPAATQDGGQLRLYWRSAERDVRMADVDPGVGALVQAIDGRRSARAAFQRAAASLDWELAVALGRAGFAALSAAGLLTVRRRTLR